MLDEARSIFAALSQAVGTKLAESDENPQARDLAEEIARLKEQVKELQAASVHHEQGVTG